MKVEKVKNPPKIINRCDICGKMRPWKDLHLNHTPDTHFGGEENYFECTYCIKKESVE